MIKIKKEDLERELKKGTNRKDMANLFCVSTFKLRSELKRHGLYKKIYPHKVTEQEINKILDLKNKGFTISEIANIVGRSEITVSKKIKENI